MKRVLFVIASLEGGAERVMIRQSLDVMVSFLTFTNVLSLLTRLLPRVPCRLIVSERSAI